MTLKYILLCIYMIGAVIAFVCAFIELNIEEKEGKDVSEAPAAIPVMAFLSWWYVYHFTKQRLIHK